MRPVAWTAAALVGLCLTSCAPDAPDVPARTAPASRKAPRGTDLLLTPTRDASVRVQTIGTDPLRVDVTLTNLTDADLYYAVPPPGPNIDATPRTLRLGWDLAPRPSNVNVAVAPTPRVETVRAGASKTFRVEVADPVQPRRWAVGWYDDMGLPIEPRPSVFLKLPLTVTATFGVSRRPFRPAAHAAQHVGFRHWYREVSATTVIER